MRRFLLKTGLYSLIILAILVGVNYIGDAARIFDGNYEKRVANIIFSGKYVTNVDNYDERLLQVELINRLPAAPQVAIIGSSRTMLINSSYFPGQTVFNTSVSGASVQDLVAIYQCYKMQGRLPKKLIIGVDPWTFNANNNQNRWKSISGYYNRFMGSGDTLMVKTNWDKYQQLISPSYFQSSMMHLHKPNEEPVPTTKTANHYNTKLTDGSLVYGVDYRDATEKQIDAKIKKYMSGKLYGIEGFTSLSADAQKAFEKMISDAKAQGIEIEFCLVPYHPKVYSFIKEKYKTALASETYVRQFAAANNIIVHGSYNPNALRLNASYFYDGMHAREVGMQQIMTQPAPAQF